MGRPAMHRDAAPGPARGRGALPPVGCADSPRDIWAKMKGGAGCW